MEIIWAWKHTQTFIKIHFWPPKNLNCFNLFFQISIKIKVHPLKWLIFMSENESPPHNKNELTKKLTWDSYVCRLTKEKIKSIKSLKKFLLFCHTIISHSSNHKKKTRDRWDFIIITQIVLFSIYRFFDSHLSCMLLCFVFHSQRL